jgi:hypothetical protein
VGGPTSDERAGTLLLCILYEGIGLGHGSKKSCMFSSQELRLHAYHSTEKQIGFMANTEFKKEREVSHAKKGIILKN